MWYPRTGLFRGCYEGAVRGMQRGAGHHTPLPDGDEPAVPTVLVRCREVGGCPYNRGGLDSETGGVSGNVVPDPPLIY